MTLQELSKEVRAQFTLAKRDNGEEFWTREILKGTEYGDWITDLCHNAHGEMLPDDWVYEFIVDALDAIEAYDDEDEARDNLPEEYRTHRFIEYYASHGYRQAAADEILREALQYTHRDSENLSLTTFMAQAMREEQEEVFSSVLQSLTDRLEEIEEEEE